MTIDVSPIPNFVPHGYKTVNVLLTVKNTAKAIDFYNRAFNAEEVMRLTDPSGRVVHAEIKINDTIIMLTEEDPFTTSPQSLGGTPVTIQIYVGDVESVIDEAVVAGCELILPVKEQYYGDRSGLVRDPFGHQWIIATHVEDLTANELQKRFHKLYP